jgi:hypothetical protein
MGGWISKELRVEWYDWVRNGVGRWRGQVLGACALVRPGCDQGVEGGGVTTLELEVSPHAGAVYHWGSQTTSPSLTFFISTYVSCVEFGMRKVLHRSWCAEGL